MLIPGHVGELLVPTDQTELFRVDGPKPPMIRLAFQVQAVVAAIWALNFHTSYYILPKQAKNVCLRRLIVRLVKATSGYS